MTDDMRSQLTCDLPATPADHTREIDNSKIDFLSPLTSHDTSVEETNQSTPHDYFIGDNSLLLARQQSTCSISPDGYLSVVEPMPLELPADPKLAGKWKAARKEFVKAVKKGDRLAQEKAFGELISVVIRRHHLEDAQDSLQKSRNLKRLMEVKAGDAKSREFELIFHPESPDEILNAFNGSREFDIRLALHLYNSNTIRDQEKVIAEKERIRAKALSALEDDLHLALGEIEEKNDVEDGLPRERTLSPMSASIFADTFKALGDYERAKKYYNAAAFNPMQSLAGGAWFRLQALEMDVISDDKKKIADAVKEIEDIRSNLTHMLFLSYDEAAGGEDRDAFHPESPALGHSVGLPNQVHEADALSWGILYNAYSKMGKDERIKMAELEREHRQMVKGRIGKATKVEARVQLDNLAKIAFIKTNKGGELEQVLRERGQEKSGLIHEQLKQDVYAVEALIGPYMKVEKGDRFFEQFAGVYWQTFFDGNFVRDYPLKAIRILDEYILRPREQSGPVAMAETEIVKARLAYLRETVPQIFDQDGRLDPTVDLSDTKEGKEAAQRVMTAYWKSPDTVREVGLPLAASVACYGTAALLSETIIVPVIAAFACAGGGSLLNREINEIGASEQRQQAAMTAISQISEKEARIRKNTWYTSEGINNLFNAAAFAPVVSVWGKLGYTAVKAGTVRAGELLTLEAITRSISNPLALGEKALKAVGGGIKAAGSWYWKLPVGTRVRLAGLAPAAADYAFIDKDGNLVAWDGELNHWYGYAGLAAGVSEGGYQIFRRAWRPEYRALVEGSGLRKTAIRSGADLLSADYFLVKEKKDGVLGMGLVDFGAPRKTDIQKYAFDAQFDPFDTWLGKGGLLLFGGDWLWNEFKVMTKWDKRLLVGGGVPLAVDLADGNLDTVYGGLGGSVFTAVLGYRLLNVNAAGSMIFLPFKLSYEWLMQWQQEVPLKAPDPKRMISSTAESIFMMSVVQGTYQGAHYWNTFPLGQSMYAGSRHIPIYRDLRCIQDWGRYQYFGNMDIRVPEAAGKPEMIVSTGSPSIEGWAKGSVVRPRYTKTIDRNSHGGKVEQTHYQLRGDKLWDGLAKGHEDVKLRVEVHQEKGVTKFFVKDTSVERAVAADYLLKHGYIWREGNLWEFKPVRRGSIRRGGQRMTVDEIKNLNDGARARVKHDMQEQGWRIVGNHFERSWIEHPYHPEILTVKPSGPPSSWSTAKHKIVESSITVNGKETPVWLKFSRRTVSSNEVVIGGKERTLWRGQREKPHFTGWGVAAQFLPVLAEAGFSNAVIFRRTSSGDPVYQPWQRVMNYIPTLLFTWPVIQARFGLDSPKGRGFGALVGYGPNLIGNWMFPTYRNTAPGQVKMNGYLDKGKGSEAFRSFGKIVTSFNPGPWGPAYGSMYEIENPALDNLRHGFDCRIDLAEGQNFGQSPNCVSLPPATQKQLISAENDLKNKMKGRFDTWAKVFHEKMEIERRSDLSERERRLLIVLGAWFKTLLYNRKDDEKLANIKKVTEEYEWFFKQLPPNLGSDQNWKDFVGQVNAGRAKASNFYFDPHIQNGTSHQPHLTSK